ncbi:MAG: exodeoxyribonuclease VII small subunit [Deltaproteobacteria bacterium]
MSAKTKEPSFEEALRSLEGIVARLESGEANLDESIRLFEEGMKLSGICQKRLDEADQKIETLLRKPGGETVAETEEQGEILGKEN